MDIKTLDALAPYVMGAASVMLVAALGYLLYLAIVDLRSAKREERRLKRFYKGDAL